MEVIKKYRDNKELRDSFNALAEKTFDLNFENWYQNGYWKENYNPYSIMLDGKIVANVSVNYIDFMWNGEIKHLIQLGTVMTEMEYRNRGLIRIIMDEIEKDCADKCDGFFLFANDTVLDFYPKFGYRIVDQYEYSRNVNQKTVRTVKKVSMTQKKEWDVVQEAIEQNQAYYGFDMTGNSGLCMFYLSQFMTDNVYYESSCDAYIVAEEEQGTLVLDAVFATESVDLDKIVEAFGPEITHVTFAFVPSSEIPCECDIVNEEDTTLFVKGKAFEGFEEEKLMFPVLSHA